MSTPKSFSIALPVRNGGEHLKLCVASVLGQTLADEFELLILENCSTDGSAEWLAKLRDPRVRVYPAERPLSMEENWARIVELPKQTFLTTIGHDDLLDSNFLSIISELIDAHPDANLYLTHFRLIDARGAFLRHCFPMPGRETAAEFLAARLGGQRDSFGTGHVMRSALFDAVGGIPAYPKLLFADDALFLQVIGSSYRATAFAEAFSYRTHPDSVSTSSSGESMFAGLETYADLLGNLKTLDPGLDQVLERYFPAHALTRGSTWYAEALRQCHRAGLPYPQEVKQRIHHLATRFGAATESPLQLDFRGRLLEKAFSSKWHRLAYLCWLLPHSVRRVAASVWRKDAS